MKRFLTTTATALVLGNAAYGDAHSSAVLDYSYDAAVNLYASELIGMRVYASETDVDDTIPMADGGEREWDDIGEIDDIILTRTGEVGAVIVGVGGFLGLGEKDVALDMSQIKIMREDDDQNDFFLVVTAARAMLEEANSYERERDDMTETQGRRNWTPFTRPDIAEDGYVAVEMSDLTAEGLTGARVYGVSGDDIGEVSEVVLNDDGTIKEFVLDIGGFFGIGETNVPVSYEELNIQRADSGDDIRVYIDATQEGLEKRVN